MAGPVHYFPIVTTVMAFAFAWVLFVRWRARSSAPHLAWWALGALTYGAGTLIEASVTLLGWAPGFFRAWYISGALMGGAPLAQGTAYLLVRRRAADRLAIALGIVVAAASALVLAAPLRLDLVEPHRLTGRVLGWPWVRAFSPFINLYAFVFLVGGAVLSAVRYARRTETVYRAAGNALIAAGALLPGIGGTFTRFGYTEVLYVTELIGLVLIVTGYRVIAARRTGVSDAVVPVLAPR